MKKSTIAILGRPNVGKSTLFNRIVGKTHSIVSPIEGVTRDRISDSFNWRGEDYNIIDTGGFIHNSKQTINKEVNLQSSLAHDTSDLILFLMDSRSDITANDRELAQKIIRSGKPYIFVLNKIDTQALESNKDKFYELGLEEPVLVSAQTGYNIGNLLDVIVSKLPGNKSSNDLYDFSIAVIGMPNVGKSSFVNRILNKKQSIVTNIAGTTRDSVDSYFRYFNKTIKLIDTAGLRKKTKIKEDIEFYSLLRTNRSIDDCDVSVVIIDAIQGFGNQDRDIVRMIIDKGKGMVLVVNKWDLIEKDSRTMNNYLKEIIHNYPSIEHYPIIFTSVLENKRIQDVLSECLRVYDEGGKKIKTNELNNWLNKILSINPPPAVKGKHLKIKYISQVRNHPPLFTFFTNHPNLFPISYKRYLENQLRQTFGFDGVSLKISFRQK